MVDVRILGEVSEEELKPRNDAFCLIRFKFTFNSSQSIIDHGRSYVIGPPSNQCYCLLRISFWGGVCQFPVDPLDPEV